MLFQIISMMLSTLDSMRRFFRRFGVEKLSKREFRQLDNDRAAAKLENDRLAVAEDYWERDFSTSEGVYCGVIGEVIDKDGQVIPILLRYKGAGPILLYGPPRSGKFTHWIAINLCLLPNTIVCSDPKIELYLRARDHRAHLHGEDNVIVLAPNNKRGIVSRRLNPLEPLMLKARRGEDWLDDLDNFVEALLTPENEEHKKDDTEWVKDVANEIIQIYLGSSIPYGQATLGGLWDFAAGNRQAFFDRIFWALFQDEVPEAIKVLAGSFLTDQVIREPIEGYRVGNPQSEDDQALAKKEGLKIADPNDLDHLAFFQWRNKDGSGRDEVRWHRNRVKKSVRLYRPGSDYRAVTDETDFELSAARHEPHSIFVCCSGSEGSAAKTWQSLTLSAIAKGLADEAGPVKVTLIMDELTTIPKIAKYEEMVLEYPYKGLQFISIAHSRKALDARYGKNARESLEAAAAVTVMWSMGRDLELCKEVSELAGEHTVAVKTTSVNPSEDTNRPSYGQGFHKVRNLSPAQVAGIGGDQQIIISQGYPSVGVTGRLAFYDVQEMDDAIGPPIEGLG